jgi:putative transposase
MAIWRRKHKNTEVINSNWGSQFGSDELNRWCKENYLRPSMGRTENCWGNVVAELILAASRVN